MTQPRITPDWITPDRTFPDGCNTLGRSPRPGQTQPVNTCILLAKLPNRDTRSAPGQALHPSPASTTAFRPDGAVIPSCVCRARPIRQPAQTSSEARASQPGRHEQAKSYVGHQQTNQTKAQPAHQYSLKGGDPAAGSPTATLLRLHPSHRPHRGKRPPCG